MSERDDATSPFPLERERSGEHERETNPIPLEREKSGASDRDTSPFPLEREKSEPALTLEPAASASAPLTEAARTARRSLVGAIGVHSLALLAFASFSLVRWSQGVASPPELTLCVLAIGVAVVHLRASSVLSRLGRDPLRDGAVLASSLTSLRAVLVVKAIVIFVSLALVCFSLSMVVSLIALL